MQLMTENNTHNWFFMIFPSISHKVLYKIMILAIDIFQHYQEIPFLLCCDFTASIVRDVKMSCTFIPFFRTWFVVHAYLLLNVCLVLIVVVVLAADAKSRTSLVCIGTTLKSYQSWLTKQCHICHLASQLYTLSYISKLHQNSYLMTYSYGH